MPMLWALWYSWILDVKTHNKHINSKAMKQIPGAKRVGHGCKRWASHKNTSHRFHSRRWCLKEIFCFLFWVQHLLDVTSSRLVNIWYYYIFFQFWGSCSTCFPRCHLVLLPLYSVCFLLLMSQNTSCLVSQKLHEFMVLEFENQKSKIGISEAVAKPQQGCIPLGRLGSPARSSHV